MTAAKAKAIARNSNHHLSSRVRFGFQDEIKDCSVVDRTLQHWCWVWFNRSDLLRRYVVHISGALAIISRSDQQYLLE